MFAGLSGTQGEGSCNPLLGSRAVVVKCIGDLGGELGDIPVGVDVAACLNRGVAEQFWIAFRFPVASRNALPGGVPSLVQPLAAVLSFATISATRRLLARSTQSRRVAVRLARICGLASAEDRTVETARWLDIGQTQHPE